MGLRRRDGVAWPACSGAVNSGRRGTPEDGAAATGWGAGGRAGAGVGFGGAEERQGAVGACSGGDLGFLVATVFY